MTGKFIGSTPEAGQLPTGGGLEPLLKGGGGPTGGIPGEVCEVGTEKVKGDQANMAKTGKKLDSNFIPSRGLLSGTNSFTQKCVFLKFLPSARQCARHQRQ